MVTGASGAIGRALAIEFASAGFDLVLAGRDRDRLQAIRREATTRGANTEVVVGDLSCDDDLENLAESASNGIDVLLHAAGCIVLSNLDAARISDLDGMFRVNLRAPALLVQQVLPRVRDGGALVFVNSPAALRPGEFNTYYAATKGGLKSFADGLRVHVAPRGIRVLSVYPALTAGAMGEYVKQFYGSAYVAAELLPPEAVAQAVRAWVDDRGRPDTDLSLAP
jgi:short-subunit dehydrogenase